MLWVYLQEDHSPNQIGVASQASLTTVAVVSSADLADSAESSDLASSASAEVGGHNRVESRVCDPPEAFSP